MDLKLCRCTVPVWKTISYDGKELILKRGDLIKYKQIALYVVHLYDDRGNKIFECFKNYFDKRFVDVMLDRNEKINIILEDYEFE